MMKRFLAALCLLLAAALPAQANVWTLLSGATATMSAPNPAWIVPFVPPAAPLQNQGFIVSVTAASAGPSCTVQFLGSNDGVIWTNYGATITASAQAGGSSASAASGYGTIPFPYIAAVVTAISGTGAKCSASMGG